MRDFTIDGTSVRVPGCCEAFDLAPLIGGSAKRGQDRLLPGTAGVIANPRRKTVTKVNLELKVFGDRDFAGVAHADYDEGLALNMAHLQANVADPPTIGDTRTGVLTWGSLSIPSKPLVCDDDMSPETSKGGRMILATLRLSFPEGTFDLSGLA